MSDKNEALIAPANPGLFPGTKLGHLLWHVETDPDGSVCWYAEVVCAIPDDSDARIVIDVFNADSKHVPSPSYAADYLHPTLLEAVTNQLAADRKYANNLLLFAQEIEVAIGDKTNDAEIAAALVEVNKAQREDKPT